MGMQNLSKGADSVDLVAEFAWLACIPILCEAKEVVPEMYQLWYRVGPASTCFRCGEDPEASCRSFTN